MPKKSRKKNKHFRSWNPKKWLMAAVYLLVIAAIVCLYAFQPNKKRLEINRLASVYMHGGSNIGMMQILRDVWSVYSTKGLVPCDIRPPDDLPIYGGIPRCKTSLTLLRNDAYWVGYSEEKRSPLWAAYRLTDVTSDEKPAARAESFMPDRRTTAQVTSDQYTNSGYDRGHLASSYSIAKCFGNAAQMQTFLMSNVVPQRHAFNAGIWKSLEMKEINTFAPRCQSIWIITGPIYPAVITHALPSGIPVPEAFYKIILDEIDGRLRAMAFIIEHDPEEETSLSDCLVSIDEIEKRTGLDFFTGFPETVQTALEGTTNTKIW